MAKNSPPTSGVLVPNNQPTSYIPPATTTRPTTTYVTPGYYYHRAPASVVIARDKYLPPSKNVQILEIPSNDISSFHAPSIYYEPPLEASPKTLLTPIVVLPSSTPASDESDLPPIAYHSSSTTKVIKDESHLPPLAYYPSSTVKPHLKNNVYRSNNFFSSSTEKPTVKDESHLPPLAYYPSSTESPFDSNSVIPLSSTLAPIVVSPLSNDLQLPKDNYADVVSITARPRTNHRHSSQSSRHEASRNVIVDYDRNSIDEVGRSYDGVGVTRNGFRYFLPRQYQEEVTHNDESRDGSYGYVDPFGIRRVVYYNAGKNGFVHRKNNRYVGHNSTPYDPRPN